MRRMQTSGVSGGARSSTRVSAVHPAIKREAASNAGLARAAAAVGSVALSASGALVAALGSEEGQWLNNTRVGNPASRARGF